MSEEDRKVSSHTLRCVFKGTALLSAAACDLLESRLTGSVLQVGSAGRRGGVLQLSQCVGSWLLGFAPTTIIWFSISKIALDVFESRSRTSVVSGQLIGVGGGPGGSAQEQEVRER